jgi:hypothetical protein
MDIELTPEAEEGFDQLPTRIQSRVLGLVERLEKWPQVSGVKPCSTNGKATIGCAPASIG